VVGNVIRVRPVALQVSEHRRVIWHLPRTDGDPQFKLLSPVLAQSVDGERDRSHRDWILQIPVSVECLEEERQALGDHSSHQEYPPPRHP
jgi:hypothetical protein